MTELTRTEKTQLDLLNSLEQELDKAHSDFDAEFGRRLQLENRLLVVEAQLNSLRDAARNVVKYAGNLKLSKFAWVESAFIEALQDELNKE